MMRVEMRQSREWVTSQKPRVEQAMDLSIWVVGLRAQWVRYRTESVSAAPAPGARSI
jgi:hypothetical protein